MCPGPHAKITEMGLVTISNNFICDESVGILGSSGVSRILKLLKAVHIGA